MKNIRKIVSVALVTMMTLSFVGCNSSTSTDSNSESDNAEISVQVSDDLVENAETFINYFKNYNTDGMYAMTSEDFKAVVDKEKMEKQNKSLNKQLGKLQSYDNFRVVLDSGYKSVLVYSEFEKGTYDLKISFTEDNKYIEGYSLQESIIEGEKADTKEYKGEAVTFGDEKYKSNGTLLVPKNTETKVPAVVLVHGSGPNDRDETINGINKPFKDIAEGLAENGIAVLRYDKRTYTYGTDLSQKEIEDITPEFEILDDVAAAVDYLKSRDEIDTENIFVLGHSLSGYFLPLIYDKAPSVKGGISLAGAIAVPFEDLMKEQYDYLANYDGKVVDEEKTALEEFNESYNLVKDLKSGKAVDDKLILGMGQVYWNFLNNYNGLDQWDKISKPTLVLQGERDYQLPMENFETYKNKLADKNNFVFKSYKKLSHIFMKADSKPSPGDYTTQKKVEDDVIKDISSWIKGE